MNECQLKVYPSFLVRNHFQINAGAEMLPSIVMRIPMQETKSQESDVAA